jgi:hypothetical protein
LHPGVGHIDIIECLRPFLAAQREVAAEEIDCSIFHGIGGDPL